MTTDLELHRFTREFGLSIVFRITHVELFFVTGRSAAEILREARQRFRTADQDHDFVRLNRFCRARNALERNHRVIPVLQRTRFFVRVSRFALTQFTKALLDVVIGHFRLRVGHLDAGVFRQIDFGKNFKFRLEPDRFAVMKVNVGDAGRPHHAEIFFLRLCVEKLRNQMFQHLLADVAAKVSANQRGGSLAGTEAGQLCPALERFRDFAGFFFHRFGGYGNLQLVLATFY